MACAATPPPPAVLPPPEPPRTVVLDEPQVEQVAGLLQMADRRSLDPVRWLQAAASPEPAVRTQAALAAGRIGDGRARPALLGMLGDTSAQVRAATVFALGRLADTSAVVTRALGTVLEGTDSAALEAPAALASLNTAAAYDLVAHRLVELVAAGAQADPGLSRECLLALWRFRERPGAEALAGNFVGAADPEVRWAATYFLGRAGTARSVPWLLALSRDPDPSIRATAARALGRNPADSAAAVTAARSRLRALLGDSVPAVRINAVRALAALGQSADGPLLLPALADPDAAVRRATAEALGKLPQPLVASALLALAADSGMALALRATALASAARADPAGALQLATQWAGSPDWLERLYAARVAANLDYGASARLLATLSRDVDGRVQGEAFAVLAAADTALPLAPVFLEGLGSSDPVVRANAADGLGRRRDPAFLSALLQAYDRAQQDSIDDAALAAVDALGRLADRGVAVAPSFFLRFRRSADPVVRTRVARRFGTGPGSWGEARTVDTGHDAAYYRQVVRAELAPVLAGADPPQVAIHTAAGEIVVALDPVAAPLTVHHFLDLIRTGFFQRPGLRWHRVVPDFVLQAGDPRGDGAGGPSVAIRDEINLLRYDRGAVGMALAGADTGGSQFFITSSPQPHLDGGYTIFGRVVAGMDVADAVTQDDPIYSFEVTR